MAIVLLKNSSQRNFNHLWCVQPSIEWQYSSRCETELVSAQTKSLRHVRAESTSIRIGLRESVVIWIFPEHCKKMAWCSTMRLSQNCEHVLNDQPSVWTSTQSNRVDVDPIGYNSRSLRLRSGHRRINRHPCLEWKNASKWFESNLAGQDDLLGHKVGLLNHQVMEIVGSFKSVAVQRWLKYAHFCTPTGRI